MIKLALLSIIAGLAMAQDGLNALWSRASLGVSVDNFYQEKNDALHEALIFRPYSRQRYSSWQIDIYDSDHKLIQKFEASSPLPKKIAWLGIKSDGSPAKDGFYRIKLVLAIGNGQKIQSAETGFSLLSPPVWKPLQNKDLVLVEDDSKIIIRLPKLMFPSGSYLIATEAERVLDAIIAFLNKHPNRPAYVLGYSDNSGNLANNQKLSEQRARSIYSYLLTAGIPSNRVRYKGLGHKTPIADNRTVEGRSKNRRVEIWMSKIKSVGV